MWALYLSNFFIQNTLPSTVLLKKKKNTYYLWLFSIKELYAWTITKFYFLEVLKENF